MKEIKFRAWDIHKEEMSTPFQLGGYPAFPNGRTVPYWPRICPIMQFTGLPDKNGKEIYDRDWAKRRIHLVEGGDYMDYTCEVRWNGWCYGLFVADKQLWGLDPITARSIEVTGNIYENPNLLT